MTSQKTHTKNKKTDENIIYSARTVHTYMHNINKTCTRNGNIRRRRKKQISKLRNELRSVHLCQGRCTLHKRINASCLPPKVSRRGNLLLLVCAENHIHRVANPTLDNAGLACCMPVFVLLHVACCMHVYLLHTFDIRQTYKIYVTHMTSNINF